MPYDSRTPSEVVASESITHSDGIPLAIKNQTPTQEEVASQNEPPMLPAEFYRPFLSDAAKNAHPSPIRSLMHLETRPGMISMLAGKPNSDTFPITSIKVTTKSPIGGEETTLEISGDPLREGLQYTATTGIPSIVEWMTRLQERSHGRRRGPSWRLSMGSGSQDVIYKTFHSILNPGDPILVESPVYAGVVPILRSLHCNITDIGADENGIKTASLRSVLEAWPADKPRPKVLYTVPYGCNPSGVTTTPERRREVLALAREFNFLIMEDDAYFYLYYGQAARPPSYFSLETEQPEVGRVIRFDSFSKILSSGMRLGLITGPPAILESVDIHTSSSNLQVASLTQTIAVSILQSWGYDGFITHTQRVSEFYRQKRDIFQSAMLRHLDGLAEWTPPDSGMFFWFKLLLNSPNAPNQREDDSHAIISSTALERGVLALPGTHFLPKGEKTAYVRASFSLLGEEEVEEGLKRLREVILDARAAA